MAEKRERTTEEIEAARKKRMANLMSAEELNARKTPEERREQARLAGIASGEAKRRRRTAQEIYAQMLDQEARPELTAGLDLPEGATNYDVMLARMMLQGQKGNVKAATFVRDTAGDMPTTKVQADVGMTPGDRALLAKVGARLWHPEGQEEPENGQEDTEET